MYVRVLTKNPGPPHMGWPAVITYAIPLMPSVLTFSCAEALWTSHHVVEFSLRIDGNLQLHSMLVSLDNSSIIKENALHAIGNMVRSSTFCVVFNQMHG